MTSGPAPISLDELTRRLAEIDALLDGGARDPRAEQYALLKERDGLRPGRSHWAVSGERVKLASQSRGRGDFDRIGTRVTEIPDGLRKRRSDQ